MDAAEVGLPSGLPPSLGLLPVGHRRRRRRVQQRENAAQLETATDDDVAAGGSERGREGNTGGAVGHQKPSLSRFFLPKFCWTSTADHLPLFSPPQQRIS